MIYFGYFPGTTPYKLVPVPGLLLSLVLIIICDSSVEYFTWKSSSLKSSISDCASASRADSVSAWYYLSSSIALFPQYPVFLEVGVSVPAWNEAKIFFSHRRYSVDQVPPPLVIGLDENWDKKVSHGHVRFSQIGAGSDKHFF